VYRYAKQLDSLGHLWGDPIRQLPYNKIGWNGSYKQNIILGVGFGTTATRSLQTALYMMGLDGDHYGQEQKYVADYVLGRQDEFNHINATKCRQKLRAMFPGRKPAGRYEVFPKRWSTKADFLLDTPVAELFLDLYATYPNAKYILTTRPAAKWVHARRVGHSKRELAPKQEPCREWMQHYSDKQLEKLFNWHSELVRCMVPKDRLLEINPWEDSPEKQTIFMDELQMFVNTFNKTCKHCGRMRGFPKRFSLDPRRSMKLALKSMGEQPDEACTSEHYVASAFQNRSLTDSAVLLGQKRSLTGSDELPAAGTHTVSITSNQFGLLMQEAALRDCEVVVEKEGGSSDSGARGRPHVQWMLQPEAQ
jgi:hypothetical protein